jgi:hypothetical protein
MLAITAEEVRDVVLRQIHALQNTPRGNRRRSSNGLNS